MFQGELESQDYSSGSFEAIFLSKMWIFVIKNPAPRSYDRSGLRQNFNGNRSAVVHGTNTVLMYVNFEGPRVNSRRSFQSCSVSGYRLL